MRIDFILQCVFDALKDKLDGALAVYNTSLCVKKRESSRCNYLPSVVFSVWKTKAQNWGTKTDAFRTTLINNEKQDVELLVFPIFVCNTLIGFVAIEERIPIDAVAAMRIGIVKGALSMCSAFVTEQAERVVHYGF